MKIWTCEISPRSGPQNVWRRIKNVNFVSRLRNLEFFQRDTKGFLSRLMTMYETWLHNYDSEAKQHSMERRHSVSPRPKNFQCKNPLKNFSPRFFGSRLHPPHWLSSKGSNYQLVVLLISAGAIEGHFEGKMPRKITKGFWFLHDNVTVHRALATQKKLAYLGFQCLDHPLYSPDLAPLRYQLFSGLK